MDFAPVEALSSFLVMLAPAARIEIAIMIATDYDNVLEARRGLGGALPQESLEPVDLFLDLRDGAVVREVTGMNQQVTTRYLGRRDFGVGV